MAFPFVAAPALGLLTLIHSILWMRTDRGSQLLRSGRGQLGNYLLGNTAPQVLITF
jgi:hypothetical protein